MNTLTHDQPLPELDPRRWMGLCAALMAPFLSVLDFFVVNLALPQIESRIGATFAQQQLVIAFYGLAYAVFVVTGGRMGDTHGRKRMFMIGLATFLVASLLCGLAPSPWFLIAARLAQGLGASLAFPQVLSLIQVSFPEHERPRALAYFGLTVGLASIAGQLLGGFLIELDPFGLGWRVLFLINLPLGGIALWIASRTLRETRGEHPPTLDLSGVAIATLGLVLLLVPLIEGHQQGWPAWAIVMLALSVPVLILFVRHERTASARGRDPLVDLRLFELATFRRGALMITAYFVGGGSLFLVLSIYLQRGLGLDARHAALLFTPFAGAVFVSSLIASRHVGPHRTKFLFGGFVLLCVGLGTIVTTLALDPRGDARLGIALGLGLYGLGQGCVSPVMYATALSGVPLRSAGAASGVVSTCQQVSSALGVALIGLVFSTALAGRTGAPAYATAAAGALAVNVVTMSVAAYLSTRLPRTGGSAAVVVEA